MKRLFNEYQAETQEGRDMSDSMRANAIMIARYCVEEDLDLCDAEFICIRAISGAFAEARLKRAIYMKARHTKTPQPIYKCTLCGINEVNAKDGFDTCIECAHKRA